MQRPSAQWPWATVTVLLGTGLVTGLQFVFPGILLYLQRTPSALHEHQWWRLITPLFVQSSGWPQIAFNFPAILIVGSLVEYLLGSRRWLILYFIGGFVGELAGYAWQPYGAGSSVAGAGLLGGLAVCLLKKPVLPARFGALSILVGAALLTYFRDVHGPPVLAGAGLALAMTKKQNQNQGSL